MDESKVSIREMILLAVIVALSVGWWLEYRRGMPEKLSQLEYSFRQSEKIKDYWRTAYERERTAYELERTAYELERSYLTPEERMRRELGRWQQSSAYAPVKN